MSSYVLLKALEASPFGYSRLLLLELALACFVLVLVDLELNLTRSTLLSCSSAQDHLQVAPLRTGDLLIQIVFAISYLVLNFVQILV